MNPATFLILTSVSLLALTTQTAQGVAPMPAELAEARQWAAARFEGAQLAEPTEPALVVLANHDRVQKHGRHGKPMKIVNAEFLLDHLLTEQGIDLYRQDFNLDPLNFWRKHDAPDRQGITEIRHLVGQWRQIIPYYYGDYYPLTPWTRDETAWMAFSCGPSHG